MIISISYTVNIDLRITYFIYFFSYVVMLKKGLYQNLEKVLKG